MCNIPVVGVEGADVMWEGAVFGLLMFQATLVVVTDVPVRL